MAVFDPEESAVRRADNLAAVLRKKRRVLPVERRSNMRTFVDIAEDIGAFAHDEQLGL